MAAKIKMMRLLQEASGFAQLSGPRFSQKTASLLALPGTLQPRSGPPPRRKRTIAIQMQDTVDIPHPVEVKVLAPRVPPADAHSVG